MMTKTKLERKTYYDGKTIYFDSSDWIGIIELMDHSSEFDQAVIGENSDGERVMISVNADNVTVQTFQKNGWVRENVYYRDYTVEELYHR